MRRQGSSFNNRTVSSIANSIKTNTTNNEETIEEASNESSQHRAIKREEICLIKSASLQSDSNQQYQVGLNIFEELSNKYNRELKSHLKSKKAFGNLSYR